jgi:hypothetical protein
MRWSVAGARRMLFLREVYVLETWSEVEALCGRQAA